MLGVHPGQRDRGIGFALKRAQWQMVRHQGLDRVTWTYDPLLSRNGQLNIAKLGAVCNTYRRDEYGEMRDGLNVGLPSDRFQVDWWVNTNRVRRRLSKRPRQALDLGHFLSAGAPVLNPAALGADGWPRPASGVEWRAVDSPAGQPPPALALVEIPADFPALKAANPELALEWRLHTRQVFEQLFEAGYLATDFISGRDFPRRSYYVLSYGESTL
jgi:predicted GNAT superfamily acetyltransferase